MDPRAWKRFRKNKGALFGGVLVILVSAAAVFGPWFAPHDPAEQFTDSLIEVKTGLPKGPMAAPGHLLGGDTVGRDELTRLLYGGRVSLQVALFATAFAVLVGLIIGVTTGFFRGPFDFVSMRFVDILLSIPFLIVATAVQKAVDSPSLWSLYLLLGFLSWTTLARVTRAKTMQVAELDFVQAARALGASRRRIIFRHILPNVLGPAIVLGTTLVSSMIIAESALSFLGLGVRPPAASWGSMLKEGQEFLAHAPRLVLYPGLLIMMTVFGFNLLGEGLRDALDPKDSR